MNTMETQERLVAQKLATKSVNIKMSKTFYTSDLHFAHKNIVKFTDRGLVTTQEGHDDWLKDLWNSQVGENDTVIHLGDFSFRWKLEELVALTSSLNGRKVMILGNHDDEQTMRNLLDYTKSGVCAVKHYMRLSLSGCREQKYKAELFHFPIASWRDQAHGSWHLHGHSHGNYADSDKGKILDVGLDSAYKILGEHRFFTEDDIINHMNAREVYTRDHHRKVET